MNSSPSSLALADALTAAQGRLDTTLSRSLSGALGISYGEFRLLHALSIQPDRRASRVDLAALVGLTPSGVTRALKPLERIGVVESVKHERDARLTLAALTRSGARVVANGIEIIEDRTTQLFENAPKVAANIVDFTAMLEELATR